MNLADPLGYAATAYPNGVAVEYKNLRLTYRRLRHDVELIASQLHEIGVRQGEVVGVHVTQSLAHWIALLALMRLGAVSVSLTNGHKAEIQRLPELSRIVATKSTQLEVPQSVAVIHMDKSWLTDARPFPSLPDAELCGRSAGRIFFTSGASGTPKAILLDAETLGRRLSGTAQKSRIHTRSTLWCGLGPDAAYGFTATIAAWMSGANVCLSGARDELYGDLTRIGVNLIIASPAALQSVLISAKDKFGAPLDGQIIVAGGRLTGRFRDLVRQKLGSDVLIAYGSSETGGVTLADATMVDDHPGRVGHVFPDVRVEIVDESDETVAPGEAGYIRIRTGNSATGYLNDPAGSAAHFKKGWFYPGDQGSLSSDSTLTLLGRPVDILNIDGVKVAATEIDAAACTKTGVVDACAVSLPTEIGVSRLAIAVVAEPEALVGLAEHVRAAHPSLPQFAIVPVTSIPRSSMGKVDREAFANLLAQQMRKPGSRSAADASSTGGLVALLT
jgi:acyl-coenzyme A synthetase/AMP-(fatty) acid ligase